MTKTTTYTKLRTHLKAYLDEINDTQEALVVERKQGSVVVMPLEEWESWLETFYLLKSPAMAKRLEEALNEPIDTAKIIDVSKLKNLKDFENVSSLI